MVLVPGLPLRNRVVMAPMTTWASNNDGTVSDEEGAYYRRRAKDVGLVNTGCAHVQRRLTNSCALISAYGRFPPVDVRRSKPQADDQQISSAIRPEMGRSTARLHRYQSQ
jgi:hypothetical protein